MIFRTIIPIKPQAWISHSTHFMLLGSCFAENIGQRLLDFRFRGDVNPFGVLYNPLSIAQALERLTENRPFVADELFEHNSLWHSWMHHGSFSDPSKEIALEKMNQRFCTAVENLAHADLLSITFGSAWVYEFDGKVVANCHKVPNNRFVRRRLTMDEIVVRYTQLFAALRQQNPKLKVLLSVSPIRYLRNAATENQTSKATLLLATEALCQQLPDVDYFPAYEIVLDELRDYRFFADDMVHPSPMAVAYVWERFAQAYFTAETCALLPEIDKENRRAAHRPLHAGN